MKKLLAAGIAVAAFCGAPAFAADMPVKAPMAAPYDPWTGFYTGGSIGGRWSDVDWQNVSFTAVGAGPIVGNNTASLDDISVRVGGYIGYNWKIAPAWLAGLEADIAWADNKKTITPIPLGQAPTTAGPNFDSIKLGWDGSVRGRLGVLVSPTWLLYGTGGVAWQEIKANSTCIPGGGFCGTAVSGTTSTTKAGWTIGGGMETALPNNWLARAEYRYADFGHITNDIPLAPVTGVHSVLNVKTQTALFGLAYKY
jgi:outer membrane immunogenic protein